MVVLDQVVKKIFLEWMLAILYSNTLVTPKCCCFNQNKYF